MNFSFSDREWTRNGLTATISREEWGQFFGGWAHVPTYDVWVIPTSRSYTGKDKGAVRVTASARKIPGLDMRKETREKNLGWLGTAWDSLLAEICEEVVIKRGLLGDSLPHPAQALAPHLDCVEICRTGIIPDLKTAIDAVDHVIAHNKWLAEGDDCGDFISHTD